MDYVHTKNRKRGHRDYDHKDQHKRFKTDNSYQQQNNSRQKQRSSKHQHPAPKQYSTHSLLDQPSSSHSSLLGIPNFVENLTQSTEYINSYYISKRQGNEEYQVKLSLIDRLYNRLSSYYRGCGLYLVGSSVNGFGEKDSDVDMCLMLNSGQISWDEAISTLQRICSILRQMESISRPYVIKATVPIIDFIDRQSGKECDMNLNSSTGIRNSHLLACYCNYDPRVAPLVVFVKKWAKFQNINSAKDKTLSSYVLTLMVLHFLQHGVSGNPVLPCLQNLRPDLFPEDVTKLRNDIDFDPIPDSRKNSSSVSELLLDFFRYYTHRFNFERSVASVRCGGLISLEEAIRWEYANPIFSISKRRSSNRNSWLTAQLYVEDPIDRSNAARCVHDEYIFSTCRRKFQRSYEVYSASGRVESIISHPF